MPSRIDVRIQQEIEQLYSQYAYAVDELDTEMLADCYLDHATFRCSISDAGSQHGRDAIVARQVYRHDQERFREKHQITNVVVLEADADEARCYAAAAIFATRRGETHLEATGHYEDELRRDDDGSWRFARRAFVADHIAPDITVPTAMAPAT